jgi:hypothetical protein
LLCAEIGTTEFRLAADRQRGVKKWLTTTFLKGGRDAETQNQAR